jgi:hypothetical protein
VPVGSQARVCLPQLAGGSISESGVEIWKDGHPVNSVDGLVQMHAEKSNVVLTVGSGDYQFLSS